PGLGIERLRERGRALEVAEQHRHDAPLASQSGRSRSTRHGPMLGRATDASHFDRMAHVTQQRTVAVLGATGTVGQRFISLLADHPWFKLTALTTSDRNAGKRYADAVHWHLPEPMPASVADMKLEATRADIDADLCFSALPADAAEQHEAALAKAGHHVFSNASTHRMDADVPN